MDNMTTAVLDNGLNVLVQEVHTAPLASVWCWYRVGSKDETTGLTGVSHWVEHMNFKGTTNIPREQIKGIIEKFGGSWNGYTWIDQTTYMETASTEGLDQMLFVEAERMANCVYDPDDCEAERTVIISELQGSENDPDTLLEQEVIAAAYKVHPYRHPTIGWLSDLQTMTRDDLYQYYRRNYLPNNAIVIVVGDVDSNDVLRRIDTMFGKIPAGASPQRVRAAEPEQFGERRVEVLKEGTTAYLKLAYRAPAVADADFFPMLVLDAVIAGAKGINLWSSFRTPPPQRSARLYRALVERRLASNVGAGLLPTEHPFLYLVSATAMEGVSLAEVNRPRLPPSMKSPQVVSPIASWSRPATSCEHGWSSKTTV
jgi:zinc protease